MHDLESHNIFVFMALSHQSLNEVVENMAMGHIVLVLMVDNHSSLEGALEHL